MKYLIAGQTISLSGKIPQVLDCLQTELRLYPLSEEPPDISLSIEPCQDSEVTGLAYPMSFERANFLRFRYSWVDVAWHKSDSVVDVIMNWKGPSTHWRRKITGIQYSHPMEDVGMMFHELVLVPAIQMYFNHHVVPIHASAVETHDGRGIVFSGLGGVGKTTISMLLYREHGCRFLADDMVFLDKTGRLWPNYAYPKFYAYNLDLAKDLRRIVFSERGILDKCMWEAGRRLRSPSRVRRRVDPTLVSPAGLSSGVQMDHLIFMIRVDCSEPEIVSIESDRATALILDILWTEYSTALYNNLRWHRYNQAAFGHKPLVDVDDMFRMFQVLLKHTLRKIRCDLVIIPFSMPLSALQGLTETLLA